MRLVLRSYLPPWEWGENNLQRVVDEQAELFAAKYGVPVSMLPEVVWQGEQLSRAGLRQLYRDADSFVLPTRGEGWGLPIVEAMAMGLPTIATNFSGHAAAL